MYVSEWHVALAQDCQDSGVNRCADAAAASFVSAGLAWMQDPELHIERAHLYGGRGPNAGLFAGPSNGDNWFSLRAPALVMFLQSDLSGRQALTVQLQQKQAGSGELSNPLGILDAVDEDYVVTALAARDETNDKTAVVLTNFDSEQHEVELLLAGLTPSASLPLQIRTLTGFADEGVQVGSTQGGDSYYRPVTSEVDAALAMAFVVSSGSIDLDGQGEGRYRLLMPAYSVTRVDL